MPISFFCSQGIKCVQKFVQHPTYVSTYITKQQDAAFPAVTVCPENPSYKSDVLEVGKFAFAGQTSAFLSAIIDISIMNLHT